MAYLVRRTMNWFCGRSRRGGQSISLDLDDHTLRDIGFTRADYRFQCTGVQVGAIFDDRALLTPRLAAQRMVRLSSNGFSCRNACLNENAPS